MPQLDISTFPSQIFWLVICFAILCFAMVTFLVPRMSQAMASRASELNTLQHKANQLLAEAEKLNRQNAEKLQTAKHDVNLKISEVTIELAKLKDEKIHAFESKLQQQAHDLQNKLNKNKEEILATSEDLVHHLIHDMYRNLTGQDLQSAQLALAKTTKKKGS